MIERALACFPAERTTSARVRGALDGFATVHSYPNAFELTAAIRSARVSATILIIDATTFDIVEPVLRRLAADFPSHRLVGYFNAVGLLPPHYRALAVHNVEELVQAGVDDSPHMFRHIIEQAERRGHARVLWDRLSGDLPAEFRDVFRLALERAGDAMDVPQLASALGVPRRTLAHRLKRHHLPPPRTFFTWSRLLIAGVLLDDAGRTLDSVAEQLEFHGGHALGAIFSRYLKRGVNALREDGVLEETVIGFRKAIGAENPSCP